MAELRPTITKIELVTETDDDPDLSWLADESNYAGLPAEDVATYMAQDAERLADYGNGWYMVGVVARAHLRFATEQGGWVAPFKIVSSGLWGVESDSGSDYLAEVGQEQLAELGDLLAALGVPADEVAAAIAAAL